MGKDVLSGLLTDLVQEDILRTASPAAGEAAGQPAAIDPLVAYRIKVHRELGGSLLGDMLQPPRSSAPGV